MESESSFYLICPSNASMNLYSDNTPGEFRINLPKRIKLRGRYEVGLAEISYPVTFETFDKVSSYRLKTIHNGRPGSSVLTKTLYLNVEELLDEIIDKIAASQGWHSVSHVISRCFTYKKLQNRVTHNLIGGLSVRLSQEVSDLLGYKDSNWISSTGCATYPPDIRNGMHQLFVYSNIVEPQLVGDVYAPLLRTVAIAANITRGAQRETVAFDSPHYVSVITDEISTIEINIKRDSGENVSFLTGKSVCTLHFRRKTL